MSSDNLKVAFINIARSIGKFFQDFFIKTKQFLSKLRDLILSVFSVFPKWEKIFLIILFIALVTSLTIFCYQKYLNSTYVTPAQYGEYKEGIIADSINDVQPIVSRLSKVGLVRFDEKGEIKSDLTEKWEVSDDQKTYTFYLPPEISSQKLVEIIRQEKPSWSDIEIEIPEEKIIKFKLKQPFAPLLANLTTPIFPYGPFKIQKESKSEIVLVPREDTIRDKPYLKKIILKLYPNYDNLFKALKGKQISGIGYVEKKDDLSTKFIYYQMKLPRYLILFFNLNSPIWEKKTIRQKLSKGESIGEQINTILATSTKEVNVNKAQELKDKWKELGVNIDIRLYEPEELQSEIIPKRQYDLLLYGLDYGYDPDPYPFWHSSQAAPATPERSDGGQATDKGLNLANFSHVDADKLLEQARLTLNQDERNKKYEQFQNIFNDEAPAIILEQEIWPYAISEKIKGITGDFKAFTPSDRYFAVEKWYVKEKRVKK